ncbi:MAG: type VI secretion system-associated FHA domain protein TagH [Gammaproteobacteria bacterium]
MLLTLTIIKSPANQLPPNTVKVFDTQGGSIGRGPKNDLVLPDPKRYLSTRHASIYFEDGQYFLADTSANGVYVNEEQEPVGSDRVVALADGDRLHFGEYEIEVSLGAGAAAGAAPRPAAPLRPAALAAAALSDADETLDPLALLGGGEPAREPVRPPAAAERDDAPILHSAFTPPKANPDQIPADWDAIDQALDGLAPMPAAQSKPAPARGSMAQTQAAIPADWDAIDQALDADGPSLGYKSDAEAFGGTPAAIIPEDALDDLLPGKPAPKPAPRPARPRLEPEFDVTADPSSVKPVQVARPAAPRRRTEAPPQAAPVAPAPARAPASRRAPAPVEAGAAATPGAAALLAAFMEGAEMDAALAESVDPAEFMKLAGTMFRCVVEDLIEVMLARSLLKGGFRMEVTRIHATDNNPLKFAPGGADEAMEKLLFRRGRGYMPPLQALHESFMDLKEHQLAMIAGLKASFVALLRRFEPAALERDFEPRVGRALLGGKKARYWELYGEFYQELQKIADDNIDELFNEAFGQAYEDQVHELAEARKSSRD